MLYFNINININLQKILPLNIRGSILLSILFTDKFSVLPRWWVERLRSVFSLGCTSFMQYPSGGWSGYAPFFSYYQISFMQYLGNGWSGYAPYEQPEYPHFRQMKHPSAI